MENLESALDALAGATTGFVRQAIDPATGLTAGEWQVHTHSPRYSCAQANCRFATAGERAALARVRAAATHPDHGGAAGPPPRDDAERALETAIHGRAITEDELAEERAALTPAERARLDALGGEAFVFAPDDETDLNPQQRAALARLDDLLLAGA